MTAQEVINFQPGQEIFWKEGKKFFKGIFLGFNRDVLDIKSLSVKDENGNQDEILHVMLIDEETYLQWQEKSSKHKIITKNNFVQNKIEKKEDISDEEISEEITENQNIQSENILSENIDSNLISTPPITNVFNISLSKVSSPRGTNSEIKPNLNTLQKLLNMQNFHIERDPNKWVRYILTLPNKQVVDFIFKGKVWELYNIYIEKGIQGLLDLRS